MGELRRFECWRHSSSIWAKRQLIRRTDPQSSAYGGQRRSGWQVTKAKQQRSRALSAGQLQSDLGGAAWTEQGYYVAKADAEAQRQAAQREREQSLYETNRAKGQKAQEQKREEETHKVCAAVCAEMRRGTAEIRKTLDVVDAYKETLETSVEMYQEETVRCRASIPGSL